MRRIGELWPQVVTFENLLLAYRKARRGKAGRAGVTEFALGLEGELLRLQSALVSGEYQPGAYRLFTVYERKPRQIAAAPFCDRVVHHAVMNLIEPALDRSFIFDSYACRKGKGAHAAVERYQGWARRYPYALKMDVARYFPSVDRDLLKEKLCARIKDHQVLALLGRIIDTAPEVAERVCYFPGDDLFTPLARRTGIPIGNLTSQFFANLYLDDLDHYLKERLRARTYLRYVDDMVLLGDDKARLADTREAVREHLARERLRLHPRKSHITRTRDGLDLLGYHVYPDLRLLRNDNGHRFARRLRGFAREYAAGRMEWKDFDPSVQSWIGHARLADTEGLRWRIFSRTIFTRGAGLEAPGA